jgi:hypothetical protein
MRHKKRAPTGDGFARRQTLFPRGIGFSPRGIRFQRGMTFLDLCITQGPVSWTLGPSSGNLCGLRWKGTRAAAAHLQALLRVVTPSGFLFG